MKKEYSKYVEELCGVAGNYMGEIKPIRVLK